MHFLAKTLYLVRNMFDRQAKPIRIIDDPDDQCPDKWSFTVLYFLILSMYQKFRKIEDDVFKIVCYCPAFISDPGLLKTFDY